MKNSAIFTIQNGLCGHSAIYLTTVLHGGSYRILHGQNADLPKEESSQKLEKSSHQRISMVHPMHPIIIQNNVGCFKTTCLNMVSFQKLFHARCAPLAHA